MNTVALFRWLAVLLPFAALGSALAGGSLVGWNGVNGSEDFIPRDATNLVAAADRIALRSDGTVLAWGPNEHGQNNVPTGLSNVVAIAAGGAHRLALRSDGTVVSWGKILLHSFSGPGYPTVAFVPDEVPAGLTNVIGITTSGSYSLALRADGTLARWGSLSPALPEGLSNVVSLATGGNTGFAAKGDGTVAGWEGAGIFLPPPSEEGYELLNIPLTATNITKVATSGMHALALTSNGTVIAWGANNAGECNVPTGLTNVVDITAGAFWSLALREDGTVVQWPNIAPTLPTNLSNVLTLAQSAEPRVITTIPAVFPQRLLVLANSTVTMEAQISESNTPVVVQWFRDDLLLPSATNMALTVSAGNGTARYRVEVQVGNKVQSSVPNYVKGVGTTILKNATVSENGMLALDFQALQPGRHRVQYSENLRDWFTVGELFWSGGFQWHYDEIYLPPAEKRYYRTQQVY